MARLDQCISLHATNLSDSEKSYIRKAVGKYKRRGMSERQSNINAINEILSSIKNNQPLFSAGDAENLSGFSNESQEAVYSVGVLHSTHLDKSLKEIYRVLKPGGQAKIHLYTKTKTGNKWVLYYSPTDIKKHAENTGFKVEKFREGHDTEPIDIPGVSGKVEQETHLVITTLRKPKREFTKEQKRIAVLKGVVGPEVEEIPETPEAVEALTKEPEKAKVSTMVKEKVTGEIPTKDLKEPKGGNKRVIYKIVGENLRPGLTRKEAIENAKDFGILEPTIKKVYVTKIDVGDEIMVDLLRGGKTDEAGITRGGKWTTKTGVITKKIGPWSFKFEAKDGDVQSIDILTDFYYGQHPYKDIKLLREAIDITPPPKPSRPPLEVKPPAREPREIQLVTLKEAKKRWTSHTKSVLTNKAKAAYRGGEEWVEKGGRIFVISKDKQWGIEFKKDDKGNIYSEQINPNLIGKPPIKELTKEQKRKAILKGLERAPIKSVKEVLKTGQEVNYRLTPKGPFDKIGIIEEQPDWVDPGHVLLTEKVKGKKGKRYQIPERSIEQLQEYGPDESVFMATRATTGLLSQPKPHREKLFNGLFDVWKQVGLPTESISAKLSPVIKMAPKKAEMSLKEHLAAEGEVTETLETTEFKGSMALVNLSLSGIETDIEAARAWVHPAIHSLVRWNYIPQSEMDQIKKYYADKSLSQGWNEEMFANDAADYWLSGKWKIGKPHWLKRVLWRVKRLLVKTRNALNGRGFFSIEDVFGKTFAGEYAGKPVTTTPETKLAMTKRKPYEPKHKSMYDQYQSKKQVPTPGIVSRFTTTMTELRNKAIREYEHLPRTKEFSQLRYTLLRLQKQKQVASESTLLKIRDITKAMDDYEYDMFNYKVLLDDLLETAQGQVASGKSVRLPPEFTIERIEDELTGLNEEIEHLPKVKDAISLRNTTWDDVKRDYTKAMKDIGFDVSKLFRRKHYFRHIVLDYVETKGLWGTGKRLKTPTGRGFQKARYGSELDILTDYITAEHEVMAQMLYDIEIANTVKMVDEHYNIVPELKIQAAQHNYREILKHFQNIVDSLDVPFGTDRPTAEEMYRQLNVKQAIGFDKLGQLAAQNALPTGPNNRYADLIDALAYNRVENKELKSELGKEWTREDRIPLPERVNRQLLPYASYILKKHGGEPGSGAAATIFKGIQEKRKFIKETLGDKYVTWDMLARHMDGYDFWQPRQGNVFYFTDSIPAKMAEGLAKQGLIQLTSEQVNKILAMGGLRKQFVLKNEIIDTLDNLLPKRDPSVIAGGHRALIKAWKVWQLLMPRRYVKYNLRNLTGDADAAFAGNPSTFTKVPRAVGDLFRHYILKEDRSLELQDWFSQGGGSSTLQAQEMGEIQELFLFKDFLARNRKKKLTDIPAKAWRKYWQAARLTTDFRESVLRYAAYLDYLEQMKANKSGRPRNFGASISEEIMGIKDIKMRAFVLSNQLLGAYDQIGKAGQSLREHVYPFWSWKEVNFKRYMRLMSNAAHEGNLAGFVGRKAAGSLIIRTPYRAYRLGSFLVKATAFSAMITLWNRTVVPDDDDKLPEGIRNKPHITLGHTKDGDVVYFSRLGALYDLLENFGLDAVPQYFEHWANGSMSLQDIAVEMAKSPANVIVNGLEPFAKTMYEVLTRQALFPDIYKPKTIRDRSKHIMRGLGLENEYDVLMGKPHKPYSETLLGMMVYHIDPLEADYRTIYDAKFRWLKKQGKMGEGFWLTPRGDALYNMRLALRYEDYESYKRYRDEYVDLALGQMKPRTVKELRQGLKRIQTFMNESIKRMHPLYGMDVYDRIEFAKFMTPREYAAMAGAQAFYDQLLLTVPPKE